jgi:DNA polymerase-3 subunit epsilon
MTEKSGKRQIVLDTETTGLSTADGNRIIEIGCVELVNRRLTGQTFHQYINPERESEAGALEVHGITTEFLSDKPKFEEIVDDFLEFIDGAELIIHNAAFDIGFLDYELGLIKSEKRRIESVCTVLDTLKLAKEKHPGQKNNLDALCRRYDVDNSNRELHGALLDSEILADVYLAMTGGQVSLTLATEEVTTQASTQSFTQMQTKTQGPLKVIKANDDELAAHEATLERLNKVSGGACVWLQHSDT